MTSTCWIHPIPRPCSNAYRGEAASSPLHSLKLLQARKPEWRHTEHVAQKNNQEVHCLLSTRSSSAESMGQRQWWEVVEGKVPAMSPKLSGYFPKVTSFNWHCMSARRWRVTTVIIPAGQMGKEAHRGLFNSAEDG